MKAFLLGLFVLLGQGSALAQVPPSPSEATAYKVLQQRHGEPIWLNCGA